MRTRRGLDGKASWDAKNVLVALSESWQVAEQCFNYPVPNLCGEDEEEEGRVAK